MKSYNWWLIRNWLRWQQPRSWGESKQDVVPTWIGVLYLNTTWHQIGDSEQRVIRLFRISTESVDSLLQAFVELDWQYNVTSAPTNLSETTSGCTEAIFLKQYSLYMIFEPVQIEPGSFRSAEEKQNQEQQVMEEMEKYEEKFKKGTASL